MMYETFLHAPTYATLCLRYVRLRAFAEQAGSLP